MNEAQKICARIYGGGDYSYLLDEPNDPDWYDPKWRANIGDGLFSFLMVELSDREDCYSLDEAKYRVESVIRQSREVLCALSHEAAHALWSGSEES